MIDHGTPHPRITPLQLFHRVQSSDIIRPRETVLYLACGTGHELCGLAALNPEVYFIGVDAAPLDLQQAQAQIAACKLDNVGLCQSPIQQLDCLQNSSIDGVVSTMALHQLTTSSALKQTFCEIKRVLKPGGGVYLADFIYLSSAIIRQRYVACYDRQQLPVAFKQADFQCATALYLATEAYLYFPPLIPFMGVLKSSPRRTLTPILKQKLMDDYQSFSAAQRKDWKKLCRWFYWAGLTTTL